MSYQLPAMGQVEPPPLRPVPWIAMVGWGVIVATAAGLFYAVVNTDGRVRANRRRSSRRARKNPRRSPWFVAVGTKFVSSIEHSPETGEGDYALVSSPRDALPFVSKSAASAAARHITDGRAVQEGELLKNVGTQNWYRSGGLYRQGNWAWDGAGTGSRGNLLWWNATLRHFSPVAESVTLDEANEIIRKTPQLWTWDAPKPNGRRRVSRNGPRWTVFFTDPGGGRSSMSYATKRDAELAALRKRLKGYESTIHRGHPGQRRRTTRNTGRRSRVAHPAKGSVWTTNDGTTQVIVRGSNAGGVSYSLANPKHQPPAVYSISHGGWAANFKKTDVSRNAGRRTSRPAKPKFSDIGVLTAVGVVRSSATQKESDVLPPGIASKFKKLPPGIYKYGYGPKKGEVIQRFKNASLRGALTSTRIGAKSVGEYHWVVDNFDPSFPVVIRGIDDQGKTFFRVEEFAKQFEREPAMVRRRSQGESAR